MQDRRETAWTLDRWEGGKTDRGRTGGSRDELEASLGGRRLFFIDGYADRTEEREAGQEGSRTGEMHVSLQAKVKLKFSYTFGPKVPRRRLKLFISVVDPE